jgi:hypothetical protein
MEGDSRTRSGAFICGGSGEETLILVGLIRQKRAVYMARKSIALLMSRREREREPTAAETEAATWS